MFKNIIVAVSGGPDSMALLDILRKKDYKCIVAHVNYGQRKTAIRDQQIVEDYCNKYNLTFELLTTKQVRAQNFQAYARDVRYDFLIRLSKKYDTSDVYVAHHEDDVLETYIMQQERGITPDYYGIDSKVKFKSINIIRPLLDYSKQDILNYCYKNDIDYGVDETNLEKDYDRNRIRIEVVNKMSDIEKAIMLSEIENKNTKLKVIQNKTNEDYNIFINDYKINYILDLKPNESINVLRHWFKVYNIFNISGDEYLNILQYLEAENNSEYTINEDYSLFKDYDKLTIISSDYEFSFIFNEIVYKDYSNFKVCESGSSFEAVSVSKDDFPITIRNFIEGDTITMQYGNKRVSRWFIDNKIEPSKRRSWPIVLNNSGEVILVPQIGCNVAHYSNNPNMFVVK